MPKIECEVDVVWLEDDQGRQVKGVRAKCTACGHETVSYGEGHRSIQRCLALMREQCPMGEKNWYAAAEGIIDHTMDDNPYDCPVR
jgi:ribosomal protein S27E